MKRLWPVWATLATSALVAAEPRLPGLPIIPSTQSFSFAVLGDNRGDDSGEQPAAFLEVLEAARRESPAFVLDTGDMIYGHSRDESKVWEEWRSYRNAAENLQAPFFHVPGNHDIWDSSSARIYRQLWGPTYYSFVYGNSLFIGVDTETARNQVADDEFQWIRQELQQCTQSNVFLFFHAPLFPVGSAIGSSLDHYPEKRDRLHKLLTQHHRLVRGVFEGHEHLFDFQERDGVPYYISGGGGAPLYAAAELGGFHHFLMVRVTGNDVKVELEKVCAPSSPLLTPRRIQPGEPLESWNKGLFWYAWDRSATIELIGDMATQGNRALRMNFDQRQYARPVLVLSLPRPWDLTDCESLILDVYVPNDLGGTFSLTPAVEGLTKNEAAPVGLKSGWNTVVTRLGEKWLPGRERRRAQGLEWSLSGADNRSRGYVVFDNLRVQRKKPNQTETTELLESWERPLLWRVFDETVGAETTAMGGAVLHLDLALCKHPVLFAKLNPPWDLTDVKALELEMEAPDRMPEDMTVGLVFRAKDVAFAAPVQSLPRGAAKIHFSLNASWLPQSARASVEQVAFRLESANRIGHADLRFKRLGATTE